jgi:DNA-binding PadR family transcriptional regulator
MSADTVQYAVLGLISSCDAGIHGYQLKNEFDALFGEFWVLNYGQMYRTLDRLERSGLIEGADILQTGRPNRRVYRITASGKKNLDDWLLLPPTDHLRPLRDDLSVKLLFLTELRIAETLCLIRGQRATYLQHLSRLNKRRARLDDGRDGFVTSLLLLQADMRVRSDLAWLEVVEKEITKRFPHASPSVAHAPSGRTR